MPGVPMYIRGVKVMPTKHKNSLKLNIPALLAGELGILPNSAVSVMYMPSFIIVKKIQAQWHLEKEWEYKRLDGYRLCVPQRYARICNTLIDDLYYAFLTNYAIIFTRCPDFADAKNDLEYEMLVAREKRN